MVLFLDGSLICPGGRSSPESSPLACKALLFGFSGNIF